MNTCKMEEKEKDTKSGSDEKGGTLTASGFEKTVTVECLSDDANHGAKLLQQVQRLEADKRKMQNEFNGQRAKLKELFMQKESEYTKGQAALQRELDELKSQFVVADLKSENEMRLKEQKAQEEISSLQQLVQDTIEESTNCKSELERIKEDSNRLWLENRELREELHTQQQQESTGLAPQMLSQVKKTLARKLGGDSVLSSSLHQDSSDDLARTKDIGKQYAHEDAEVLRSIVVQLQEEMRVLKDKLREADEQLQANHYQKQQLQQQAPPNKSLKNETAPLTEETQPPSINKSTSMDIAGAAAAAVLATPVHCDTCHSYEIKVKDLLEKATYDHEKIDAVQRSLAESREDLQNEAALRKDLEDQWQEKREAHKTEVQLLREQVKLNEQQLLDLQQQFLETKEEVVRQLQRVSDDRERVNKQLETLQADNDFLSGRYLATAEEIESQNINLPNTVEELQELMLRQQSELIQARVGSDFEKQKCVTSLDEIQILRDQLDTSNNERRIYKKEVQSKIKSLQDRVTEHLLILQNYETTKNNLERKEAELNRIISEFRVENIELQDKNEKLNKITTDYRAKIKNLQEDLATSEQVQKDFVKLSQTLQMSLEKLRHADTEVRWQDDDDVDNCPSCSASFTVTVRKIHCRHCGHIYCDRCLSKTVPSGPRKRVARVCDICHTLLTPNTAPYFSHEPL